MKDYSKYFENPASFIVNIGTGYASSDEEEMKLAVEYACGKVNYYPLTKENVELFFNRLTDQYLEVCSSSKEIFKYKGLGILTLSLIGTLGATFALKGYVDPALVSTNIQVLLAAGAISSETLRNVLRHGKLNECKRLQSLISGLSYIAVAHEEDTNILDLDTSDDVIYEKGLTDSPININLIDHLSKEDLVSLKDQMDIYYGLQNDVELKRKYKKQ